MPWGRFSRAVAAALALGLSTAATSARADAATSEAGQPIVIGRSYAMTSKVLGDQRRINIYLPEHYADKGATFPVLFLLDGGAAEDFHHITGLAQINAAYGQGRELIVVGIEGVDRRRDLTSPSSVPADLKVAPTSGGAAAYRRFLTEELKPWVAGRYRTNGHTALIGESLAGLFVAETALKAPESFDDYIVVSPSLWWNGGALAAGAAADLRKARPTNVRVWIGFDDPAPPEAQAAKDRARQAELADAFLTQRPAGMTVTVARPGRGHAAIYHPAAMEALRALYGPPAGP